MSIQRQLCITCNRSVLRDRNRQVVTREVLESRDHFAEYVLERIDIEQVVSNVAQYMCYRCWVAAGRYVPRPLTPQNDVPLPEPPLPQPSPPTQASPPLQAQEFVVPNYTRTANTSRRCLFLNCGNQDLHRVPQFIKLHSLVDYQVYVTPSARVCGRHLHSNEWNEIVNFSLTPLTLEHMKDMLDTLTRAHRSRIGLNFDNIGEITPEELYFRTGLKHFEFLRILSETPSIQDRSNRPKTVLGAYLMKLRSGEPNERIAIHFNMTRKTLEKKLAVARECLTSDFVPRHLGFDHISREDILRHSLFIPAALYGGNETEPQAIIICDGTYLFIQKSMNFLFQKHTYSLHKFKNLLKPFLFVCSDGYIIEITGPHAAVSSDASIINTHFNEEDAPIHYLLHENDVFILDRGFRDASENMESCGYEVHIPPTKGRHATQLTTEEANKSRLVTIVRWVVEVINGRFKRDYKIFRNSYFNKSLPHLMIDFRIAGALLNTFREPLQDNQFALNIIEIINDRINVPNRLGDYVVEYNINRQRASFTVLEESEVTFPVLNEEQLILISLGTYQIKLAKSYVSEHLRRGVYLIEVCAQSSPIMTQCDWVTENCTLLRGRIQSRHVSNRIYYSYILMNNANEGRSAIVQHYCSCLTGRRTVGTCAHIMSIIWYMAHGRHLPRFVGPALAWDDIIIDDLYY